MRALLVSLDATHRTACAARLRAAGFEVCHYDDAEEVWEGFAGDPASLVVVDWASPVGRAVCRRIRQAEQGAATLVQAFVDLDDGAALAAAIEAGIDGCVPRGASPAYLDTCLALVAQQVQTVGRHQQVELELAARLRQQAAVAEIGQRVLAGNSLQAVMDFAVAVVSEALNAEFCKVLVRPESGEGLLLAAGVGWRAGLVGTARVAAGADSQAGYTLLSAEPVVVQDLATETRFRGPTLLTDHGVVSGLSVIVRVEGAPFGVFGVHTATPRDFQQNDVNFAQAVANVLAGAIERERSEAALRESVARARAIVDTTVDGIITIDERGRVESFNSAAETIFGYTEDEVIGQNVRVLMPPPYHEEHDGYVQSYLETGHRKIIGIGREVEGRRKDGTVFPMDLAVSEVELKGRRLFTGIVRDITERRRLEQEILRVSEEERRSIGQDLHDGLGQMLTGIGLITQNLARTMAAERLPEADELAEVTELVREADQAARGLARGLIPVDLEATGLVAALERLVTDAEKLFAGVRCTFEQVGAVLIPDNAVATHLFRIAQEALSNAVKHGQARHIRISLAAGPGRIRLRIQDDGVGFPETLDETRAGMGVRIMQHRARVIGGTLDISDSLGGGATITCTLHGQGARVPAG